jgi:hypothetical protein
MKIIGRLLVVTSLVLLFCVGGPVGNGYDPLMEWLNWPLGVGMVAVLVELFAIISTGFLGLYFLIKATKKKE